ncbi:MAG: hypothetical protein IKK38_05860 [Spirochaetaceae bacterium]|nr:hypothetical protein [Spirochaetaceae bacterium]
MHTITLFLSHPVFQETERILAELRVYEILYTKQLIEKAMRGHRGIFAVTEGNILNRQVTLLELYQADRAYMLNKAESANRNI